eukprot:gene9833-10874_t
MSKKVTDNDLYHGKQETTLSLVEDCLEHIYSIRRRALQHRKVHNENLVNQRRQELTDSPIHSPLVKLRRNSSSSLLLSKGPEQDIQEEEESQERQKLVRQLSTKLKGPAAVVAPPPPTSKTFTMKGGGGFFQKKTTPVQDAQALLADFMKEFEALVEDAEEDDEFEEDCDRLTERFFTEGLDRLPSCAEVTTVKKKISAMIEDLASGNVLPYRKKAEEKRMKQQQQEEEAEEEDKKKKAANNTATTGRPPLKKVKSVTFMGIDDDDNGRPSSNKRKSGSSVSDPALVVVSEPSPSGPKTSSVNNNDVTGNKSSYDRVQTEKERIKNQYEAYMKLKRRNDQQKESEKVGEYERLNEEIKGVLQTLQSPSLLSNS